MIATTLFSKLKAHLANTQAKTYAPDAPDYKKIEQCFIETPVQTLGVVRLQNGDDVASVVRFCVERNVEFSIRGGGHDCASRTLVDGALVIDMRDIKHVVVSQDKKTARVGGGILSGDLARALGNDGLGTPTATVASVGYTGWATLGGYGLLTSHYGLGVDQIIGAKIVNARGELQDANEELLVGIRGGGGSLGVIVELTIKVYPIDKILSSTIIYDSTDLTAALTSYTQHYEKLLESGQLPVYLQLQPMIAQMPGQPVILMIIATWHGEDKDEGRSWIKNIAGAADCVMEDTKEITIAEMLDNNEKLVTWPSYGRVFTLNAKRMTDNALKIVGKHCVNAPGGSLIFSYHTLLSAEEPEQKSVFGTRARHHMFEIYSILADENIAEERVQWAAQVKSDLHAEDVDNILEGSYISLGSHEDVDVKKVYGKHYDTLAALKRNILDKFQVPGALESPSLSGHISPIIRNAIFLTAAIGEKYLWADAIYITHEDRESTARQLTSMGAIYANAIVTVVAADGDSLTGLAGIRGISAARQLNQVIVPFQDQKLKRLDYWALQMENRLPYYERGWIYQEVRLSTRKIVFHGEQLHWMCRCSVWHEESAQRFQTEVVTYNEQLIDFSVRVLFSGFFTCAVFEMVVQSFNIKTLRYDEDAFPAISGLLSVLSRRFKGGFLYGIPEMMFERGLGWLPWTPYANLKRRTRSSRPIHPGYQEATMMARRRNELEETTPITQWYTSHSQTDPPEMWRRIRSTRYEDRDSYKDFNKPLLPGWTRHKAPETSTWNGGPHLYPDGCDEYVFTHELMPVSKLDPEKHGWYYPFPVTEVNESTLPDMPEQTEYLFCKTKKGQLWGTQKVGERKDALLYNSQKQKVGFLNLVNDDYLARFLETMTDEEGGLLVDLVASG
uniref:FAD-binding PCMH-type domain-containing protein n=1 Tax=Gibberella zeae TaxID=5518 RepID=A0A4E9EHA4_GIBZA